MGSKKRISNDLCVGGFNLAKESDRKRLSSMMVELKLQADALTQKDLKNWRQAWQMALNIENPRRGPLYDIYTDIDADLHLTGCVGQRKGFVLKKSFKLVDAKEKENEEATKLFETGWFKDLISYILDSRYWGHSLIQLGDVVTVDGKTRYKDVELIPRKHVIPEYGVIIREQADEWRQGYDYRNTPLSDWVIEAGKPKDLGLFLKAAHQAIPKKTCWRSGTSSGKYSVCLSGSPSRRPVILKTVHALRICWHLWGRPHGGYSRKGRKLTLRRQHGGTLLTCTINVSTVPTVK